MVVEGASTLFFRVAALLRVALVKVATLLVLAIGAAGCIWGTAVWLRAKLLGMDKGLASSALFACGNTACDGL